MAGAGVLVVVGLVKVLMLVLVLVLVPSEKGWFSLKKGKMLVGEHTMYHNNNAF